MRIIAGKWGGRRLSWPAGSNTRPVPDRVREAVFSMLGSIYDTPGALPPVCVADVFAGSGSMGLEALSRGAASCTFYERDKEAVAVLQRNFARLEAGSEATIVTRDAWSASISPVGGQGFDLVFLDPPYRDSQDTSPRGLVLRYLNRLAARCEKEPIVVLHHPAACSFSAPPDGRWKVSDIRSFGNNGITTFTLSSLTTSDDRA
jgi:16S rRNA (guanine966-N2)-methyltransferase